MNIKSTKPKAITLTMFGIFSLLFSLIFIVIASNFASAVSNNQSLSGNQLEEFAQNNILFYNPAECIGGTSSGLCGSNIEEKVWSILRQTLDPLHAAAAFGSIAREGTFQPVKWEYYRIADPSTGEWMPGINWNDIYNGVYDGKYGVGSFGLTSGLSDYLHYVNDKAPDLLQYFKDPSNTSYATGDELAEKIGQDAVDRLIELEVNYFVNEWIPKYKGQGIYDTFLSLTDLEATAVYWAKNIEVCKDCGCDSCASSAELGPRAAAAKGYYEKYKDFTCTASSSGSSSGGSSSSSQVSGNDITWIGDSYSENSTNKAAVESKYPGIYYNGQSGRMFANDSSRWGSSGLNILKNEIKENLRDYLVFALGTNTDAGSKDAMAKNIDDLVATAKKYNSNTKIILVSPITNNDSARKTYDAYREAMQEAVKKYDNVILADWYDVAKDHLNEYFDDHSTGGYTDKSTHPNAKGYEKWIETISNALSSASGNGCTTYEGKYPQYNQCGDSRWSDHPYGTDNICGSGCGAASMAMLATVATGQDIFPNDIADLLGNQYYDSVSIATLDPIVGKHYGFEVETVSVSGIEDTKTKLRDYLKKGYMIHFTGRGCYPGFIYSSGGCTKGHVIGLFDIDDNDMVTQANSGMGEVHQKASLDDMAKALNFGIFTAIKGSNSSKNNCDDLCQSKNVSMAGLTEEQAQKLADYYNGPDVDADEYGLPFGKTNCVSFSMWFTKAIAGLSWASGNGRDVAHAVAEEHNLSEGKEPRPYAIFSVTKGISYCGEALCGHTGIVVAVNGDEVLTVEAAYPSTPAYVTKRDRSYFENTVYQNTFTYLDSSIDQSKLKNIVGN